MFRFLDCYVAMSIGIFVERSQSPEHVNWLEFREPHVQLFLQLYYARAITERRREAGSARSKYPYLLEHLGKESWRTCTS
jgi:hypothetical protein